MRNLFACSKTFVRRYGWTNVIRKLLSKPVEQVYNLGVRFELKDVVSSYTCCGISDHILHQVYIMRKTRLSFTKLFSILNLVRMIFL